MARLRTLSGVPFSQPGAGSGMPASARPRTLELLVWDSEPSLHARDSEAMRDPGSLPIEFKMLGITPGKWTPQVVISRHQALTSNVPNEATHVRAIGALGSAEKLRELLLIEGGNPPLALDPLIDPKIFPADVLKLYNAFRDPIDFALEHPEVADAVVLVSTGLTGYEWQDPDMDEPFAEI